MDPEKPKKYFEKQMQARREQQQEREDREYAKAKWNSENGSKHLESESEKVLEAAIAKLGNNTTEAERK